MKPENFVAYTEQLTLENKQIRDLTKHRPLLPVKYQQLEIYNLSEIDEEEDDRDEFEKTTVTHCVITLTECREIRTPP